MKNKPLVISLSFLVILLIAIICYLLVTSQNNQETINEIQQENLEQKTQINKLEQEKTATAEKTAIETAELLAQAKEEADEKIIRVGNL